MNIPVMYTQEYRDELLRERFFELGRAGANANVNHPNRKEWERLRVHLGNSVPTPPPTAPKFSFNYPFLTDNVLSCNIMQIVPTGYQDVDRGFDEATGRWVANALNAHNDPVRKAAPELLEALRTALPLAELGVAAHPDANGSGVARLKIIRAAIARATGGAV